MAAKKNSQGLGAVLDELPTDRLAEQAREYLGAAGERIASRAGEKAGAMTDHLLDYVEHGPLGRDGDGGGRSPVGALLGAGAAGVKSLVSNKLTGGKGGGGGGGGKKLKLTNIVESIEVGVPLRVAYDQWTQFQDFPKFTKRVETVEQESDEKLTWKAGIFLSHRTWQSTIVEQVPDERIVWRSKGEKGRVDGTVTFHELAPNLTKILLILEYHPQGLFERTGNLWRAQGRRARLELKHFQRHLMTHTILDPDSVEGWRGEIRDGEVVRTHEDAVEDEDRDDEEPEYGEAEDEAEYDEAEDEDAEDEAEDEVDGEVDDDVDDEEHESDEEEPDDDELDDEESDDRPDPRSRDRKRTGSRRQPARSG